MDSSGTPESRVPYGFDGFTYYTVGAEVPAASFAQGAYQNGG